MQYPVTRSLAALAVAAALQMAALAVEPGAVSWTAESVTALRAIAARHPDVRIRCPDHLAARFVSDEFWHYSGYSRDDFFRSLNFIRTYDYSTYYYVNARTKHIDAILRAMAATGLQQVVNLGAGFDSRAYRFHDELPDCRFFELDLPATSRRKQQLVKQILGELPANTTYVPIDFNEQTIKDALQAAGYDAEQRTFFVWEGVTYYIDRAAVDSTLRFVAGNSPIGSAVAFDFIPTPAIEGDYTRYPSAYYSAVRVEAAGEPWICGLPDAREELATYVADQGLQLVSDLNYFELGCAYLVGEHGRVDGWPPNHFRVVHATVPKQARQK